MALKYQDYYQTIGVKRSASRDDIQSAYRKLARQYHPDVSKSPDTAEKFARIGEAYEVLKDAQKRKQYDALGTNWKAGQDFHTPPGYENVHFEFRNRSGGSNRGFNFSTGGPGSSGSFSDFFEMFCSQNRAQRKPRARSRPGSSTQKADITITLHDAYHGTTRSLQLQGPDGRKTADVKIPPGVTQGSKIRLADHDIVLRINIAPDPRFDIEGYDLVAHLPITPWEAALGAKVPLQTMDGQVTLTIPPAAPSESSLRLAGKGLPKRRGGHGDLYAKLKIVVPKKMTDAERKLFERLQAESTFNPRQT